MDNKKVLVTGASKGIGKAIAKALLNLGYTVIGTSRDPENITDKVKGLEYVRLDLNDEQSIEECTEKIGSVDILINNVGQSQIGPAEELSLEKIKKMFQTNLLGMIKLTQGFLPEMRKKRRGLIINIGSLVGRFAVPFQSIHAASKSALAAFSWSLRNEVMSYGVKVVVIEPNDINTTIEPEMTVNDNSEYKKNVLRSKEARDKKMADAPGPEVVANKVIKILKKKNPRPFYTAGGMGPFLVFCKRLLPDRVVERLIRKNYKINE
ncbi:MAG: SDR family NAD(P)-dependent oxidoreductase [Candidatus Aminicenantes bacterium]|nr:SDR family NAD(P)-dependent oxidoreductase [Candidatus Aminicenantes bacterium]